MTAKKAQTVEEAVCRVLIEVEVDPLDLADFQENWNYIVNDLGGYGSVVRADIEVPAMPARTIELSKF